MTEAMPFLQKYDITFLRPPTIPRGFPLISRRLQWHRNLSDKMQKKNLCIISKQHIVPFCVNTENIPS